MGGGIKLSTTQDFIEVLFELKNNSYLKIVTAGRLVQYLFGQNTFMVWANLIKKLSSQQQNSTWYPKKLYPILRLNFGAVHFSMTKMLLVPDSRDMYKSFGL